jgi:transposase
MLHAGLDLSRKKLDVCLLSEEGEHLDRLVAAPDVDSLRRLARRIDEIHGELVCGVVESMTGARLVHDTLEREGWDVEIPDAQRVKGLAPLACKTDKSDSLVLARLSQRDLVPAIWLPDPQVREERELARFRLHLVKHKSALKNRIHSTLINFGRPCPVTDLFGAAGPKALGEARLSRALARKRDRLASADRRARGSDRRRQPPTQGKPCRPPLHPAAADRPRDRLGGRFHDRRRDRRDRAIREPAEAHRLHRALPTRGPVGRARSPRSAPQSTAPPTCAGRCSRRPCTRSSTPPIGCATNATKSGSAGSAGRRSPRSTSPAASPTQSGTCLLETSPSLPEAPLFVWRPDRPLWTCAPEQASNFA